MQRRAVGPQALALSHAPQPICGLGWTKRGTRTRWAEIITCPRPPAGGVWVGRPGTRGASAGTYPASEVCPQTHTEQPPVVQPPAQDAEARRSGHSWRLSIQSRSFPDPHLPVLHAKDMRLHGPPSGPCLSSQVTLGPSSGPLQLLTLDWCSHLTLSFPSGGRAAARPYSLGDKSGCRVSPGCGSHMEMQHQGRGASLQGCTEGSVSLDWARAAAPGNPDPPPCFLKGQASAATSSRKPADLLLPSPG